MAGATNNQSGVWAAWRAVTAGGAVILWFAAASCTLPRSGANEASLQLQETVSLAEEVKAFERTLGIEPTGSLSSSSGQRPSLSMLWLWLQRSGTIALRHPIDIRMAIGFYTDKEPVPLERVYRVEGYSVYYRQGNEFADERSVATESFAQEGIVRRVKVIIHEDLHGDRNFDLPWEIEESIVTPLGSLAAVEFFRAKGEQAATRAAVAALGEEREISRELNAFALRAETIFSGERVEAAKTDILAVLPDYPTYARQFRRQTNGQNAMTVLEAKLSHDLAYYRYFDAIAALAESPTDLGRLIAALKLIPHDASIESGEDFLRRLAPGFPRERRDNAASFAEKPAVR